MPSLNTNSLGDAIARFRKSSPSGLVDLNALRRQLIEDFGVKRLRKRVRALRKEKDVEGLKVQDLILIRLAESWRELE